MKINRSAFARQRLIERQMEHDRRQSQWNADHPADPYMEIVKQTDLTPTAKFLVSSGGEMPLGGRLIEVQIKPWPKWHYNNPWDKISDWERSSDA